MSLASKHKPYRSVPAQNFRQLHSLNGPFRVSAQLGERPEFGHWAKIRNWCKSTEFVIFKQKIFLF
jgi:hypothetical protein